MQVGGKTLLTYMGADDALIRVTGTQCCQHEGNGKLLLTQPVTFGQTTDTNLQIVLMSKQIMVIIKTHVP